MWFSATGSTEKVGRSARSSPSMQQPVEYGLVFSFLTRLVLRAQDLGEIGYAHALGERTDLIDGILGFHLRYRHVESGLLGGGRGLWNGLINSPPKLDVPQPGHHPGRSPLEA